MIRALLTSTAVARAMPDIPVAVSEGPWLAYEIRDYRTGERDRLFSQSFSPLLPQGFEMVGRIGGLVR